MPAGPYGSAIADTFNRADGALGANWPGKVNSGSGSPTIVSNQCVAGSSWNTAYWTTSLPDTVEAGFKIVSHPAGNVTVCRIYTRLSSVATGSPNGYVFIIEALTGTDDYQIYKHTAGSNATLLASGTTEWAAGDSFALSSIGSTHTAWRHNGTSWATLFSGTDSTYTSGFAGIEMNDTGTPIDDWFVGNGVPTNSVAPVASGTPTVGSTVSTTDGTWAGSPSFTYQWQRDVLGNSSYSNIGGATSNSYVLGLLDDSCNVRCVVTGTNAAGALAANSNSILDLTDRAVPALNPAQHGRAVLRAALR